MYVRGVLIRHQQFITQRSTLTLWPQLCLQCSDRQYPASMLSSQITPETNEEGGRERLSAHTTPRTSVSFPTGNAAARPTEQNPGKRNNPTVYTTPHDAILADLLGTTRGDDLRKEERGVSSGAESSSHLEEELARTGTNQQERATPQPTSPEVLFDPFDGSPLGVLVPHQDDPHADDQSVLQGNPFLEGMHSDSDNAMWTRLSKVLDIQSQISKMHLEMEGIGNAKTADSKRKMYRMSTKPASDATGDEGDVPEATEKDPALPPGLHQPRARVSSTVSTISTAGDAEGDEEGVNVPSEEAEKNRIREEEFEKLTTQFEGRKEAISGIMSKVRRFLIAHFLYCTLLR